MRTPLLLLLDGIMSKSEDRTLAAVTEINRLLGRKNVAYVLPHPGQSPATCAANLSTIIGALLQVHAELASLPSQRDGSLPLHFAASLGNVQVASLIMSKVRFALVE